MPGLFWKPHSPQTLSAVPSPAVARGATLAGADAANDVPQERQNWASPLFWLWQTEQSLVIRSASSFPWSKDDTAGSWGIAMGSVPWRWTMPTLPRLGRRSAARWSLDRAVCVLEGHPLARHHRLGRRHGVHAAVPQAGGRGARAGGARDADARGDGALHCARQRRRSDRLRHGRIDGGHRLVGLG